MSSTEEDDGDIPSREICEKRCQDFASITGTDSACAMFYLQDRSWDLERSLNAYFNESAAKTANETSENLPVVPKVELGSSGSTSDSKTPSTKLSKSKGSGDKQVDPEPHRIRIMSWNIDGLDTNNLRNRTKGVCITINKENPDVIYLQEVVPVSLEILEEECPNYQVIPAGGEGYFIAMMLRLTTVHYEDSAITPFFSSKMARNLLQVKAKIKNIPFLLMTSHLESTKEHGTERKRQLKSALKEMEKAEADRTVVFGGDLNMRDAELEQVGGLPDSVLDLWEVTGKRPEAKFTWDLTKNDNLEWQWKNRPKCRFDRLFIKQAHGERKVKPVYFELVGLERLQSCKRFCSDHWAILSHFDKV